MKLSHITTVAVLALASLALAGCEEPAGPGPESRDHQGAQAPMQEEREAREREEREADREISPAPQQEEPEASEGIERTTPER